MQYTVNITDSHDKLTSFAVEADNAGIAEYKGRFMFYEIDSNHSVAIKTLKVERSGN